jgi:LmbE family N-acetylglucosaminyl deacetylase/glycosyltransferase involved in cell wall biosynthesis
MTDPDPHLSPSHPTVTAIVPAYNEAGRIGRVLAVLRQVAVLDEIIVVDDGSQDATAAEAAQAAASDRRVRLLRNPRNLGKGEAVKTGCQIARSSSILLLDADLVGLTAQHILDLIQPVAEGGLDMTIGVFRGGHFNTDLAHWLTPWLSGQRCIRRGLLSQVNWEAASGYGLETALTVASNRNKWRTQRVILHGVWHPAGEHHRGFLGGLGNRLRMYLHVVRAWLRARGWQSVLVRLGVKSRFLLLLLLLILSGLAYNRSMARSGLRWNDLPDLSLSDAHRLLVIAPHPDDETLGAGGLIQAAEKQGLDVRVVVFTNGDGQILGPVALDHHLVPTAADYIAEGRQRQGESLAALARLGVPADHVDYLGYPDGSLGKLWYGDWISGCPFVVRRTHTERSPYHLTFDPQAVYCGRDVLRDIQEILTTYHPDLVVLPHPNDEHPDHRAASDFTRFALASMAANDPSYQPQIWGYLVHYGFFPQPRGLHPTLFMLPPKPFIETGNTWVRVQLSSDMLKAKIDALNKYTTQQKLMRSFLDSFARQDEIFAALPLIEIPAISIHTIQLDETGLQRLPTLDEPAAESARRELVHGADLVGWQIARLGDTVWLTAETRGRLLPGLDYLIDIKTLDGHTRTIKYRAEDLLGGSRGFTVSLDMNELGPLPVVGFSAEVKKGMTLDRTGWRFIVLLAR